MLRLCFFLFLCKVSKAFFTNPLSSQYPIVILPGFGNDQIDYLSPLTLGPSSSIYNSLKLSYSNPIEVVPIKRKDWIQVLTKGIFSLKFWQGKCEPRDLYQFYFDEVDRTVREVSTKYKKPVILLGHSAGGWLARAMLNDGSWLGNASVSSASLVLGLVTLGAPHFPPLAGALDVTGGCLKFVDRQYPGAYLSPELFYVTVCGAVVTGDTKAPRGSIEVFSAGSYQQVTGNKKNKGEEIGDSVVPISSAHLSGAVQITLPKVWHSIQAPQNYWYGGKEVVKLWMPQTLLMTSHTSKRRNNSFKLFEDIESNWLEFQMRFFQYTKDMR